MRRGFTLLEVLLVIAIVGVVFAMAMPVYQSFHINNALDLATTEYAHSLRRAQVLARGMDQDDSWGVHIGSGKITLFKGSSYASRDVEFDEEFSILTSIEVTETDEFVFQKFTGEPVVTGHTVLGNKSGQERTIIVYEKGRITY